MKKKTTAAILLGLTICTCSACGTNSQNVMPNAEPQTELTTTPGNQGQEPQTNILKEPPQAQTVNVSNNTSVVNLTDDLGMGVAIDYSIKSYDSLKTFSYELFKQSLDEENPVLSPVSAYLALSMAGMGASGSTRNEFTNVLGDDMTVFTDDLMNSFSVDNENMKLSVNNSAWMDNRFDVNTQWLAEVKSLADADVFQSNLSGTDTMNAINDWVSSNTNGLIENMLEKPLDDDDRLALINTVYFKAAWEDPFKGSDTRTEAFRLAGGGTFQTQMMNKYGKPCEYISNNFAEGVILPYANSLTRCGLDMRGNLALVVIKPMENVSGAMKPPKLDVRNAYNMLTNEVISDLLAGRRTETVNLKLPKFEITFDKVLNDSLINMGLSDAFDSRLADFSEIGSDLGGGNLFISLVRQKAKIIVDEQGTEAAAATEAIMTTEAAFESIEPPRDVYFDEPFIYMIMDMDREIPLFIGILDNPMDASGIPHSQPAIRAD